MIESKTESSMRVLLEDRSFSRMYLCYYELLNHFALSMVGSPEAAEEVVSDVFIKIWKNRAHFSIKTSLKAYLYTAVRHQSIDYLRKAIRRRICEEPNAELPSEYLSPEEIAISFELEARIEAAIEALPPQGKRVFQLSRDKGLKYHEIAEHLNVSVKTVETHMCRSLRYLREVLLDSR